MPAVEFIYGDEGIEKDKEEDGVDLSVIEQAASFVEEEKDNIQEALMTNHEEDGASFMTGVTGTDVFDCIEPLVEFSMQFTEEHASDSQEDSSNFNAEYEEKVPEITEFAVPVETSEYVSSINAEWNRSPRSVLMMGNSALERSRLKRWEAAKDTARKERSDAGAGCNISDLHVPLPITIPLPVPVFIPHSRRRRTSAVIIQKSVRMFLLHRRAVNKRNQDQRMFRGILGRRIHKQLKVLFHRGMFSVRQSILKKQRSAKIIAKFFLAAVAVIRLKNFSWAGCYRMYRGRDGVASTRPSPILSVQDDSHYADDNYDDGDYRGKEQKEETKKEEEQKWYKDSSRQAATDRSDRTAVVDSSSPGYQIGCGLDIACPRVVQRHRFLIHNANPTTSSSSSSSSSSSLSSSSSSSPDKCSKITAAYHFLHTSEKSPRGSLIGPLEGQGMGSIRAMRRSMSRDSTVNNTCPHMNSRVGDPSSAPPSRVKALEKRCMDFNAKFQIRNAMPQYSISTVDAGQGTDKVGVNKVRNNRTDRQNRILRESSIGVRTAFCATVDSVGEGHEGGTTVPIFPGCAVVITPQPVVLSSIQQKIERLLGQKSVSVTSHSLVLLPVLESRCSARDSRSTALLDSGAADVKAQIPGVRYPPMRMYQDRQHMQRSASFDLLSKLKQASLNHRAPSLLIPPYVQSSGCPLIPATSSFALPISLDIHQQHNGPDPMRSN